MLILSWIHPSLVSPQHAVPLVRSHKALLSVCPSHLNSQHRRYFQPGLVRVKNSYVSQELRTKPQKNTLVLTANRKVIFNLLFFFSRTNNRSQEELLYSVQRHKGISKVSLWLLSALFNLHVPARNLCPKSFYIHTEP